MRRFKYSLKDSKKKIIDIENEYLKIINKSLSKKINPRYLKDIILCPIEKMNRKTHNIFMKKLKPNSFFFVNRSEILFNVLFGNEYSSLQPIISEFISKNFNFKICPYCGIDYVNSFKECLSYYTNFSEFILNSTHKELTRLKKVGKSKANDIINDRNKLNSSELIKKYQKHENTFYGLKLKPEFHNHYTLDHIIPKKKYPLFQISLYNLIPVCFSCNSKFKGEYELSDNLIPNSTNFKLDQDLKFYLIKDNESYKIDCKIDSIRDFDNINNYIKEFKIIGRYNEHINTIIELKENAEKYNKQKILEISRQTGMSEEEIKKFIFGNDIINKEIDSPLFKLKYDISKDLDII